jgi:hypothetical protein
MNKIVREHYPVEKLPEDLRNLVVGAKSVTIEIIEEPRKSPLTAEEARARVREMQKRQAAGSKAASLEEIVDRVRQLRDEWDD